MGSSRSNFEGAGEETSSWMNNTAGTLNYKEKHMKVQIVIELSDNARLGVGLAETGSLIPATRQEARAYLTELVNKELLTIEASVTAGIETMQKDTQRFIDAALIGLSPDTTE